MILPRKTIGLLGGGAIGRMLAQAAQALGYRVHVFTPDAGGPAGAVAEGETVAGFDNVTALKEFAAGVDVITCETENMPVESLAAIAPLVPLHPRSDVMAVCQSRQREKAWLHAHRFPQVKYAEALDGDIGAAVARVGRPCVVKAADFACDGQGQMKIGSDDELARAAAIFRGRRCVVERWVDFQRELSVIVARAAAVDPAGPGPAERRVFPVIENIHARHVLDCSIIPARISAVIAREAELLAVAIAEKLGVVGLLAVELFLTSAGELLVNELVPRPHNSGHGLAEACETGQCEQHVRAVCGLPLGSVALREPTVMVNIPGDAWTWRDGQVTGEPNWAAILREPAAKLQLYGQPEPRIGRKMGHFTVRGKDGEAALEKARELKARLQNPPG